MVEKQPLSPNEAREDLTDREITKIMGGLFGALTDMADIEQIRRACVWWADTPEAWLQLEAVQQVKRAAKKETQ